MIQLGNKAKDTLTGFAGIVTSRTEYLHGCVHIGLSPEGTDKDGEPQKTHFFDEQRIETLEEKKPQVSQESGATSGGPVPGSDRRTLCQ